MKFEQDFLLNDQLKAIGISDAFDSEKADFSRITGARNIYISDVYHKAFVDVYQLSCVLLFVLCTTGVIIFR